jgi:pimeloyl-ACP methyl ester carboxylesterase
MPRMLTGINLRHIDEGQGLPLVFLHGFPLNCGAWQKQAEVFRSSYRVIAPDLRGLGDSDTQPGPTTLAQCATRPRRVAPTTHDRTGGKIRPLDGGLAAGRRGAAKPHAWRRPPWPT